ncbi:MAG: hypothetical protein AB7V59_21780 [Gammaproteobacteria bacterium]
MSFRSAIECDAPDCTAVFAGRTNAARLRERATERQGWVSLEKAKPPADYCPAHRDLDPRVRRRDTERAIGAAVFGE